MNTDILDQTTIVPSEFPIVQTGDAAYKEWLKEQPWNQPGYNASKMKEHAEEGRLMGAAPVGYKNAFVSGEKTVVPDIVLAPLIQESFALAATGRYSLRQLLSLLTPKGLVSRNRKPLQAPSLWGILTNPFYLGFVRFNGKHIKGRHQAIIDQVTFEKVQETLKINRRNGRSADLDQVSTVYSK